MAKYLLRKKILNASANQMQISTHRVVSVIYAISSFRTEHAQLRIRIADTSCGISAAACVAEARWCVCVRVRVRVEGVRQMGRV